MFDNSKPNVILLSDLSDSMSLQKTQGIYRVAFALRQIGVEVVVIEHLSTFSVAELLTLLENFVSSSTLFVGVNNFYYKDLDKINFKNGSMSHWEMLPGDGSIIPHGKKYNTIFKETIKRKNPNVKLVLGGPNAVDHEHNKIFDYVVKGYADSSVTNLALHLQNSSVQLQKALRSIWGFTIIDDVKAENFDFVNCDFKYHDNDIILHNETLTIEISRGCVFKCKFCSFPLNGKKKLDYIRSFDLIREELIDNWKRFGATRYIMMDDTLNDSVEKCEFLYELNKSLPFQLEYWAYIRLDLLAAHPRTIELLADSGLRHTFYGIETLNEKASKFIGKGGSREKLINTIKEIKLKYNNRIRQHGSFIFGLPHEDIDSIKETINWMNSKNNHLDTWAAWPLRLRRQCYFPSDFELNYKNYGYVDNGNVNDNVDLINWQNQFTNYEEVHRLSVETNTSQSNVGTFSYIYLKGLDMPESVFGQKISDTDWHYIDQKKYNRAIEYKQKVFKLAGLSFSLSGCEHISKFSELIKYFKDTNQI
jgi:hypothetical protein